VFCQYIKLVISVSNNAIRKVLQVTPQRILTITMIRTR